jgi:FtsX-like permease family
MSARSGQTAAAPQYSSRVGSVLGAGASVTRSTGVRMALQPGAGRTAVPVRSALLGTVIAIAATVAALVFSASFLHLLDTPAQYGQNWQQELDLGFGSVDKQIVGKIAAIQPGLTDYAAGDYGQVSVNGMVVPAIGVDSFRGSSFVTMLAGRAPVTSGEIALGVQTLRAAHHQVGQRVSVVVHGKARMMTIVGTAVLPAFGQGTIIATDLGSGAVTRADVLSVPNIQTHCAQHCYNFFLARYRAGESQLLAADRLKATAQRLGCPPGECQVRSDQQPTDVRNYSAFAVRNTPLILGLVLALLAIGTLAHVLVTSVLRRRRELAVLKVLGMGRAQLLGVVMWQACAVSLIALAIGLPAGVLAGRWAWMLFAGSTGVPGDPVVSAPVLLAIIPVTLLMAALVAAIPGRLAARVRPGAALRAE